MRPHGASLTGVLLAALIPAVALADPPPADAPQPSAPSTAAGPKGGPGKAKAPEPDAPPAAEVRLWVVAPTPSGPWAFRIDNEGPRPIRIPADVRLLRFELDNGDGFVIDTDPASDPKRPKKPKKPQKPKKPTICKLPGPLRPDSFPDKRALLLAPGEAYIESFDPRLFCFGKDASAALTGGAVVRASFGWPMPKNAGKKPPRGPFAVESTDFPATVTPLRELSAPTMVLSYDKQKPADTPKIPGMALVAVDPNTPEVAPTFAAPKAAGKAAKPADLSAAGGASKPADPKASPAASAPPATDDQGDKRDPEDKDIAPLTRSPIVDENAPRLEVTSAPFLEASAPGRVTITVKATNAGHRPMLAAIRPHMLTFRIDGPGGVARCNAVPPTHGVPRDLFSTIKPGGSVSMAVLLAESCPRDALNRPGLYRITATLQASESGDKLGLSAYTGVVTAKTPTSLRLLSGPEPFSVTKPRAVPIPKPPPSPEGSS
jgi:hypothetical protein